MTERAFKILSAITVLVHLTSSCPSATPAESMPQGAPSAPAEKGAYGGALSVQTGDIFQNFRNPPPGYGEVAFYWWLGDTLTHDRILWELDQLAGKGVTGLQVNYAHSDSGGLIWGLSYPSRPKLFSEQWWNLFGWFMREAKKRGIAVSLSDYTLGVGQGACFDEALAEHPDLAGSELRFERRYVTGPATLTWHLPGKPLALAGFKVGKDSLPDPLTKTDLAASAKDRELVWTPPEGTWMISCVWAERILPSYDPMHPLSGKAYISKFFGRFAEKFPGELGKGINYFFSDELSFRLQYPIWDDAFAGEFLRQKGYDIRPHLPGLFLDVGAETPKIRLDYNEVMVSLCEEHFFQPIYQWHQERGMTMGCDHGGRGKDVAEFGDYFRTQRWLQGPGCDQPKLAQDIIKNKVASSISHLYRRPRVWLEGFHSSGWGTNSAEIADAVFGNFVMGQNLLTFHGLYYSTHGGWWEWAPPCNHFRMPYYQHFAPFMHTVQRLSYVLSQGYHKCDVAILYPVEPVVAGTSGEEAVNAAFSAGTALYNAGIDFDFIDYESLARARVEDGKITVSGEEYRVLVIPSMKTIRFASLAKARDLVVSGGTVINIGSLPESSERGRGNKDFSSLCSDLFGSAATAREALGLLRSGRGGGAVYESNSSDSLCQLVSRLFPRDFVVISTGDGMQNVLPRVMHRTIGTTDLYAVYNLPAGTECFFRAKGKVELWNPSTGKRSPVYMVRHSKEGTTVRLPLSQYEIQLIVFSPGQNDVVVENSMLSTIDSVTLRDGKPILFGVSSAPGTMHANVRYKGKVVTLEGEAVSGRTSKPLTGAWDFEVHPVLDNRWGDFHWPPTPSLIGPEVRRLAYTEDGSLKVYAGDTVSCSFGVQFWKLGPLPEMIPPDTLFKRGTIDLQAPVNLGGTSYTWHPYAFSWRWGVEDDPGHQGYHGLKEEVRDEFIRLGKPVQAWQGAPSVERQAEEGGTFYCLFTGVLSPAEGSYEVHQGAVRPVAIRINGMPIDTSARAVQLRAGLNTLMLWYNRPCTTYFVLQKPGGTGGLRPGVSSKDPEAKPLAMRWYGDPTVLRFDARFGEKAPEGWYTFLSAPGTKRMRFGVHGDVDVLVGGKPVRVTKGPLRADGATACEVDLDETATVPVDVEFHVVQERGYYGGSAIPDPVQLECLKGVYEAGDWSRNDALYAYSGGAKYSRSVFLTSEETTRKVELNLGSVISSAEIWVNGKEAGVKTAPPWVCDISPFVRAGDNSIEVIVYNTASNHYTSIPTRYRGPVTSGLLGPVTLDMSERVVLKVRLQGLHNSKQGKR